MLEVESQKIVQNFDVDTVFFFGEGGGGLSWIRAAWKRLSLGVRICIFVTYSDSQRPISSFQRITIRSNAATLQVEIRFRFHSIDTELFSSHMTYVTEL